MREGTVPPGLSSSSRTLRSGCLWLVPVYQDRPSVAGEETIRCCLSIQPSGRSCTPVGTADAPGRSRTRLVWLLAYAATVEPSVPEQTTPAGTSDPAAPIGQVDVGTRPLENDHLSGPWKAVPGAAPASGRPLAPDLGAPWSCASPSIWWMHPRAV